MLSPSCLCLIGEDLCPGTSLSCCDHISSSTVGISEPWPTFLCFPVSPPSWTCLQSSASRPPNGLQHHAVSPSRPCSVAFLQEVHTPTSHVVLNQRRKEWGLQGRTTGGASQRTHSALGGELGCEPDTKSNTPRHTQSSHHTTPCTLLHTCTSIKHYQTHRHSRACTPNSRMLHTEHTPSHPTTNTSLCHDHTHPPNSH
ncbi:hypothetical protein H1C71_033740 [Ictidomys tridecemlineatus]|nr:hypothetical protein H1C71_033740 [Ictidomys tridecemlineatus]